MICPKCGGLIGEPGKLYGWGGSWCYGHADNKPIVYGSGFCPPIVQPECSHCYCSVINLVTTEGEETSALKRIKHKVCCNCGNKQKISEAK
jgi:hypothetical protein